MRRQVDFDVLVRSSFRTLIGGAECAWRTIDRFVGEHCIQRLAQPAGRDHFDEWLERFGWPIIVSVAVGEGQAAYPVRIQRREYLSDPAAAVVTDQVDLINSQVIERLSEHVSVSGDGDIL